ncbi:MAG TPA: alpha/beta hydrolase [Burkholderiales bacterium]|nr:alpha/beta hydrolase [Burkholderiales bacterium]
MQRRSFVTSDGVTLSYLETAPAPVNKAPVIVLLPGWCMPASIWHEQFAALGARYRTLALDPRGQGESEVPAQGYTAARRAADVHEFIAAAVPARSRVLLVGWSLAALEALEYVSRYGEKRLAGLALIDSSVGELPAPPGNNDPSADSPFKRHVRNDRPRFLDEFVHAIFAKLRPEEEIAALIAGAQRMKVEDSIALLSYPFPREHWKEVVLKYTHPLLYVVTPQFSAQAESLKQHRPATRTELFRKAGHALFADEPERFNTLLLEFAASLR